jgi:methionyl aminopeptidase
MSVTIENENDLNKLRAIGAIVANCLQYLKTKAEPGMSTLELDALASAFLEKEGARSAPKICYRFPGTTCISVNAAIAHGIPSANLKLSKGDIVNIDVSAEREGYFADTGASFVLPGGAGQKELERLCRATEQARDEAIAATCAGKNLSVIGKAVEKVARAHKFTIVRNLASHGVGRALHEEPKEIPTHFDPFEKRILKKGMVITVEPFLTTGPKLVGEKGDGWSLVLPGKHRGAQFEHTFVITEGAPIILTLPAAS